MKTTEVFEVRPKTFSPKVEIAGCYVEVDGRLLLLKNADCDSEPGKWGVPAGKLETGEDPAKGAVRELFEESGIIADSNKIVSMGSLFVRKPNIDYIFHLFLVKMEKADVRLSDEHVDYRWISPEDVASVPLMDGAREAYAKYRTILGRKRVAAVVSSYVILRRGDEVLLQLRKNTGYCDGMWSFVAGHVEDGETASMGLKREIFEEIGIELEGAKPVHIMHRKSNRVNIDVFFECWKWTGEIENREVEKCEALEFFPLDRLPENMIEYNGVALRAVLDGCFYSEFGWDK
jgi:8-oxo-dGTP diphosphatase